MEVVYLDQVFAVNVLVDYCIVLAAARMSGAVLRRGRYLLAALAGGLYAAMTVLPGLGWMALAPVKAAAGIGMALIAFGGERRFWRRALRRRSVRPLRGIRHAARSGAPARDMAHSYPDVRALLRRHRHRISAATAKRIAPDRSGGGDDPGTEFVSACAV